MKEERFLQIQQYMHVRMSDSAHDREHVYRVLYNALEIARHESDVDYDVLICACLLHDIGREAQFQNPGVCHAEAGAREALCFLTDLGCGQRFAESVAHCILCHRYKGGPAPQSLEAKILFDADKLDVCGAMGIARTLLYGGQTGEPLYTLDAGGNPLDGTQDTSPSFFREYHYKLEGLYDKFYTARGAELAARRQKAAADFYESLLAEASEAYKRGRSELALRLSGE